MKKGICLSCVSGETADEKFHNAREAGFDGVEVGTLRTEEEMKEIEDLSQKYGVAIGSVMNSDHWTHPLSDPDPDIREIPGEKVVEAEADSYLEHLLHQWRIPLSAVAEEQFYKPEYQARWQTRYCIDAMLEHAVMHPIRHRFQLLELIAEI